MEKIRGVVLTKSRMYKNNTSGACVVLYDTDKKRIVRIVSDEYGSPIPADFLNRFDTFDCIQAVAEKSCPIVPQTENICVKSDSIKTTCIYPKTVSQLMIYLKIKGLWSSPRSYMKNNAYALKSVEEYDHSIEIVYAEKIVLDKEVVGNKVKTKASFSIRNTYHERYSVTDPKFETSREPQYLEKAYLIISIPSEPYNGKFYKYVAAIYPT